MLETSVFGTFFPFDPWCNGRSTPKGDLCGKGENDQLRSCVTGSLPTGIRNMHSYFTRAAAIACGSLSVLRMATWRRLARFADDRGVVPVTFAIVSSAILPTGTVA